MPKGEGQVISTFNYSTANRAFSDRDDLDKSVEFAKRESRIFYEHGLTKDITFVANAAYQNIGYDGQLSTINFDGFDKTELGLRYQIKRREGLAVAVQASYVIGGGPAESIVDIGSRQDTVEFRGLWGQSKEFENSAIFFDAQAAVRGRNLERLEDWRADLTLGWKDKKKLMLLAQGFFTERDSFGRDGFVIPKQKRMKLQASLVYSYKKNRHVQIGYGHTAFGRNIVKEQSLTIGTWLRY